MEGVKGGNLAVIFLDVFFWSQVDSSPSASSNFRTFDFTLHLGHVRLCPECRDSVDKQCTYCTLEGDEVSKGGDSAVSISKNRKAIFLKIHSNILTYSCII